MLCISIVFLSLQCINILKTFFLKTKSQSFGDGMDRRAMLAPVSSLPSQDTRTANIFFHPVLGSLPTGMLVSRCGRPCGHSGAHHQLGHSPGAQQHAETLLTSQAQIHETFPNFTPDHHVMVELLRPHSGSACNYNLLHRFYLRIRGWMGGHSQCKQRWKTDPGALANTFCLQVSGFLPCSFQH